MPIAKSSSKSSKTDRTGERTIFVGKILKAHGLAGELSVAIDPTIADVVCAGREILIRASKDSLWARVNAVRPHAGGLLLRLEGVDRREQAERLRGARLELPREALPPAKEGEYYDFELIGMRVLTTDGLELGEVTGLLGTGANDVCLVEGGQGRLLLPMSGPAIESIDRSRGRIIVRPDCWVEADR